MNARQRQRFAIVLITGILLPIPMIRADATVLRCGAQWCAGTGRKPSLFDRETGKPLPSRNTKCRECQVLRKAKWECIGRTAAAEYDGPALCGDGVRRPFQFRNLTFTSD
jgi:hypothetical protein